MRIGGRSRWTETPFCVSFFLFLYFFYGSTSNSFPHLCLFYPCILLHFSFLICVFFFVVVLSVLFFLKFFYVLINNQSSISFNWYTFYFIFASLSAPFGSSDYINHFLTFQVSKVFPSQPNHSMCGHTPFCRPFLRNTALTDYVLMCSKHNWILLIVFNLNLIHISLNLLRWFQ